MTKNKRLIFYFIFCFLNYFTSLNVSADVTLEAVVDRDQISMDESVTLKVTVKADGSVPVQTPSFEANDFDDLNQFQSSQVHTSIINGSISTQFVRSFHFVLRPKKTGVLKITEIQTQVEGQTHSAEPITVTVEAGGAGTAAPKNYGGGGYGLRGTQKRQRGTPFFIKAETDKSKAYKGEQVIVSYYLYTRTKGFNAEAEKYPALPGFLKEEIEIPLVQQGGMNQGELVTLDGEVWRRILLAKYAAYPLKTGKLQLDTMALKVQYYESRSPIMEDEEDLFTQFFSQMTPRVAQLKSEPVSVEVLSLPESGKPTSFNEVIGQFEVSASLDKNQVRANEPVTYTLRVEGRGNLANLDTPKIKIPDGFEIYESRSQVKGGKGGSNIKIFEYLLIPRKDGRFEIPAFVLDYFDPKKNRYETTQASSLSLEVLPGDPSQEGYHLKLPRVGEIVSGTTAKNKDNLPPSETAMFLLPRPSEGLLRVFHKIGWVFFGLSICLVAFVYLMPKYKKWKKQKDERLKFRQMNKDWSDYEPKLSDFETKHSFSEVIDCYAFIEEKLCNALVKWYGLNPRSLSRRDLYEDLVERQKMSEDLWKRISNILEFVETVRFASSAGAMPESRVRLELKKWFQEAKELLAELESHFEKTQKH